MELTLGRNGRMWYEKKSCRALCVYDPFYPSPESAIDPPT